MAVTKQTYTATATWTASLLADIFRSAFIDAGLMTEWHDSFLSGSVENRILRVQYDASKTYGTTFYWFMFATNGALLHVATGWNTSTDQPTGTQYLDFFSTTTNGTGVHYTLINLSAASTVELVRYTSGDDASQSWFVCKSATSRVVFTIASNAATVQSWLNLDKGFFQGFAYVNPSTTGTMGLLRFYRGPGLRRDIVLGCSLVGSTTSSDYTNAVSNQMLFGYAGIGHLSSNTGNYSNVQNIPYIYLPIGFSSTNPAYATNSNPVFHSMPYSPYIVESLPPDFGISFHYATNTFSLGDTFVVDSGVEEWEVLNFASNSSAGTGASPLFLARTV